MKSYGLAFAPQAYTGNDLMFASGKLPSILIASSLPEGLSKTSLLHHTIVSAVIIRVLLSSNLSKASDFLMPDKPEFVFWKGFGISFRHPGIIYYVKFNAKFSQ
jgi:hypothetical protein